ncbi:MAG: hypothetical protein HDR25_07135 [Lachnospiraceae bacterium]|nr:hypothetical protein [Lachnospiraceae bacterium]
MKKILKILLDLWILLNMVIFSTSNLCFVYASYEMYPTKNSPPNARTLFRILCLVAGIFLAICREKFGREQKKWDETYERQIQIKVDRESVYIDDDATVPNERIINILETDMLSDVVKKVARHYLPLMSNSVWAVDSGKAVIAYIIMDDRNASFSYELCLRNQVFLETRIKTLHCSYFSADGKEFPPIETAKRCMENRFKEKIKIKGGNLCIWGELVGQRHVIEIIEWNNEVIRIHFAEGYLHIYHPTNIINTENQLVIGDALKVLWIWYDYRNAYTYDYRNAHTHDYCYVREYTKNTEGIIFRTEGKQSEQSEISNDDGVLFQPTKEQAVSLG